MGLDVSHKRRKLNNDFTNDAGNDHYFSRKPKFERLSDVNGASAPLREKKSFPPRAAPLRSEDDPLDPDIFKLQADELLAEIKPQVESSLERARSSLSRVKDVIQHIPAHGPLPASKAEDLIREQAAIRIPFLKPRLDTEVKYQVQYVKPARIDIFETVATRTMLVQNNEPTIDMVLTMPSHIFQDKDFLNYRYFHKRAFYIASVAISLTKAFQNSVAINFAWQDGNVLQPIIVLSQLDGSHADRLDLCGYRLRIVTATPFEIFSLKKTLPWYNCLRPSKVLGINEELKPTPFYNCTIRAETSVHFYSNFIYQTSQRVAGFQDALILFAVWLRQRGFSSDASSGGFGVFESSLILAILLHKGGSKGLPALQASYSRHQLFKALISFIKTRDLQKFPLLLDCDLQTNNSRALLNAPMFLDGKRGLNVLFKMNIWSYQRLRHEASATWAQFNDASFDPFRDCFITKISDPILRYDYLLRLVIPASVFDSADILDSKGCIVDFLEKTYPILEKALGDRVRLINLAIQPRISWSLQETLPADDVVPFDVQLVANPETVNRAVDRGPPAENEKASHQFRQFWGEKAELRRFKDGSIVESTVWSTEGRGDSIIMQIIRHALSRHLGSELVDAIKVQDDRLEDLLPNKEITQYKGSQHRVGEIFRLLKQYVNELDGLPLHIRQLSLASAELRLGSEHQAAQGKKTSGANPTAVTLQFESSAKWPDDPDAIKRTKIALLLKLGELLEHKQSGVHTRLGLEDEMQQLPNTAFLDLTLSDHTFRLRIYHDRELTLLERQLTSVDSTSSIKEASAHTISLYKATYTNAPAHAEVIRSLCTSHPLLAPTILLLKRWFSRHLLLPHFDDEVIELIAASPFTQPLPYEAPASLRTGFLRIISRLARWNWRTEPLLINLIDTLTRADRDAIQTRLDAWRSIDPTMNRMVLIVGTPLDRGGTAWTERRPKRVVAARLIALAKATLSAAVSEGNNLNEKPLFATSLRGYDFLIHIDRRTESQSSVRERWTRDGSQLDHLAKTSFKWSVVDDYVRELERLFGNNVLFMHDGLERSILAGLWNPAAGARTIKSSPAYSTMPYELEEVGDGRCSRVTINKVALLHEMARLGGDIVSKIEILRPLVA